MLRKLALVAITATAFVSTPLVAQQQPARPQPAAPSAAAPLIDDDTLVGTGVAPWRSERRGSRSAEGV